MTTAESAVFRRLLAAQLWILDLPLLGSLKNFDRNLFLAGPTESCSSLDKSWGWSLSDDLEADLSVEVTSSDPLENLLESEKLELISSSAGLLGQLRSSGWSWISTMITVRVSQYHFTLTNDAWCLHSYNRGQGAFKQLVKISEGLCHSLVFEQWIGFTWFCNNNCSAVMQCCRLMLQWVWAVQTVLAYWCKPCLQLLSMCPCDDLQTLRCAWSDSPHSAPAPDRVPELRTRFGQSDWWWSCWWVVVVRGSRELSFLKHPIYVIQTWCSIVYKMKMFSIIKFYLSSS